MAELIEGEGATWRSVRGSLNSVMAFAATLLIAWILYWLLKAAKAVAELLREAFLFWNIAWSTSQRKLKKPLRLHPYLCETSYLDEVGINELYHFFKEDFQAPGVGVEQLHKVIMRYTHVLMCRDRIDGTLRGALLLGIEHKADHTLLKLGTTTFKNYYRGTPFIKLIIASLTVRELIRHPLTPIYIIGKVYSPKAYVFGLSMKGFHPIYDKETPEQYKKIFAEFAEMHISSKAGKAKYNPETFVIEQEDSYVVESLTILSEQDLQNPHIKFFVERNPGWRKGHCLVVGFQFSWQNFISTMKSTLRKTLGKKNHRSTKAPAVNDDNTQDKQQLPSKRKHPGRPKLLRRYTFQETSANTYAINNLEYDLGGEAMISPASKATFAFQRNFSESDEVNLEPTEFNSFSKPQDS